MGITSLEILNLISRAPFAVLADAVDAGHQISVLYIENRSHVLSDYYLSPTLSDNDHHEHELVHSDTRHLAR